MEKVSIWTKIVGKISKTNLSLALKKFCTDEKDVNKTKIKPVYASEYNSERENQASLLHQVILGIFIAWIASTHLLGIVVH